MCLSSDGNVVASISHDECVKFWNVENIKSIKIDAQSKSTNKSLRNKKINSSGLSDNFFADLCENKDKDDDDSDDSEDEDDNDDKKSDDSDSDGSESD